MFIKHFAERKNILALFKYGISGTTATTVDVSVLYTLRQFGFDDLPAVLISVSCAVMVHYTISRYFVFRSYERNFVVGFFYFLSIVIFSSILNISFYLILASLIPDYFVVARVVSIATVGIFSFFLNARYTFGAISLKTNLN